MPDGNSTELTVAQKASVEFRRDLEQQMTNFKIMLPSNIPPEKFQRILITAVMQEPDLLYADRRSFLLAAQKCALDGLLPDAREAVLLVYPNTKVRRRLPDGTR